MRIFDIADIGVGYKSMEISEQTRISDLIKHNKESVEAIASLAKPLQKLRNPILRKLMASRVTIAEAAKIGGCTVDDFQRVLEPLGFQFGAESKLPGGKSDELPAWLAALPAGKIQRFDVRDILGQGKDPLKQILDTFKEVSPGNALCIINSFEPVPLVRLLEKDGVKTYTVMVQPKEYHSFFFKQEAAAQEVVYERNSDGPVVMLKKEAFEDVMKTFEPDQVREIDVRHLEMPGPMQTILSMLPDLEKGQALYVNHKRIPVYLLEEIAGDDYTVNILNISEGDVKLLIWKK